MRHKGLIIGLLYLIGLALYGGLVRPLILDFFAHQSPIWFNDLVYWWYPRLLVEQQRFEPLFFIHKADQIVIRLSMISLLISILYWFHHANPRFRLGWDRFWQGEVPRPRLAVFRILYCVITLIYAWLWYENFVAMQSYAFFYRPISFLRLFSLPLPDLFFINTVYGILTASALSCIIGYQIPVSSLLTVAGLFFLQLLAQSFEKVDHGFSTWLYAGLLLPLLLYNHQQWVLKLILLAIVSSYLQAGLEKILISGGEWANTLQAYLHLFGTDMGKKIAQEAWLCQLLGIGTLGFQLFFPLVVFYQPLRYVFLLLGILFHIGVYILFGIGYYFTPWYAVYLFFIDWEKLIPLKVQDWS